MGRQRRERRPYHKKDLGEQIEDPSAQGVRTRPRDPKKRKRGDEQEDEPVSAKMSGRILKAAREQQEEVDAEEAEEARVADGRAEISAGALAAALRRAADSDGGSDDDDDEEFREEIRAQQLRMAATFTAGTSGKGADKPGAKLPLGSLSLPSGSGAPDADAAVAAGSKADLMVGCEYDDEEISPEDEKALAAFMASGQEQQKQISLGDLILTKLKEQQQQGEVDMRLGDEDEEALPQGLDDKVVEVYRGVGKLLSRYGDGKIPKAFKIIPNLKNWEEVLYLTDPDSWSPHAMYQATKLFVSSLNARLAQRFLALVLLPRVRDEIRQHQKLHLALFMALKKATYKPGAFYKGLLLPLAASRTCSLREAVIFSSVLRRTSIPVLHSAAALLRLADMEYCGTTSFFIRVLLDKKYALPYRVIDALVDHFVRFADDERQMPVVWHQCLLCFVQRYKDEVRPEDLDSLRKLCSVQHHHLVTPEVLRELDHARQRRGGGAGRATGAAAMEVQSHVAAVVGKHVSENVAKLPPVMIMEDD